MSSLLSQLAALDSEFLETLVSSGQLMESGELKPIAGADAKLQALVPAKQIPRPIAFAVSSDQSDLLNVAGMASYRRGESSPWLVDATSLEALIPKLPALRRHRQGVQLIDYAGELGRAYPADRFVGRAWLRDAVGEIISARESAYIVISAGPSFGKSAFMLHLLEHCRRAVESSSGFSLGAWHFLRKEGTATHDWYKVTTLAEQIAARLQMRLGCLLGPEQPCLPVTRDNASEVINAAVKAAGAKLEPGQKLLILVDGLDECFGRDADGARCLAECFPAKALPAGIFVLFTTRPGHYLKDWLAMGGRTIRMLDMDRTDKEGDGWARRNDDDLREYLLQALPQHALSHPAFPALLERLVSSCGGGFYVAEYFAREAEGNLASWLKGGELPRGIDEAINEEWSSKRLRMKLEQRGLFDVLSSALAIWHQAGNRISDAFIDAMLTPAGTAAPAPGLPEYLGRRLPRGGLGSPVDCSEVLEAMDDWLIGKGCRQFRHGRIPEVLLERAGRDDTTLLKNLHCLLAWSSSHWQDKRLPNDVRQDMRRNLAWHWALGEDLDRALALLLRPDEAWLPAAWDDRDGRTLLFEAMEAALRLAAQQERTQEFRLLRNICRVMSAMDRNSLSSGQPLVERLYNQLADTWRELAPPAYSDALDVAAARHERPWLQAVMPPPFDEALQFSGTCMALWSGKNASDGAATARLFTLDQPACLRCFDLDRDGRLLWFRHLASIDKDHDGHKGQPEKGGALTLSADGRQLAVGTPQGQILLLDAATGEPLPLSEPMSHACCEPCLSYSPNGAWLASGGSDGSLCLWNPATGKRGEAVQAHREKVNHLTWSGDGLALASAGEDGRACLWRLSSTATLIPLCHGEMPLTHVAFSPDSQWLATAGRDGAIRLWHGVTGCHLLEMSNAHAGPVNYLAFSPDGTRLASAGNDSVVRLWTLDGRRVATDMVHEDRMAHVTFLPDGRRLASTSFDQTLRFWDANTGDLAGWEDLTVQGLRCEFSTDGLWRAVVRNDHTVCVTSVSSPAFPERIPASVKAVAMSADGRYYASVYRNKSVVVRDELSRQAIGEPIRHANIVLCAALSPDGTTLATACKGQGVQLWKLDPRTLQWEIEGPVMHHPGEVKHLLFSSDGTMLAVAGRGEKGTAGGVLRLWRVETGRQIGKDMLHADNVLCVAFSPDGRQLASGAWDGISRLWDIATSEPLSEPIRHGDTVSDLAFSPDGMTLATAGKNKMVRLWDGKIGECLGLNLPHGREVSHVAFSPDGRYLISASWDKTLRLWDRTSGTCICADTIGETKALVCRYSENGELEVLCGQTSRSGALVRGYRVRGYVYHGDQQDKVLVAASQ